VTTPTDRIRVVLVDDHALLRDGVREILEAEGDVVVVGEAGNSATAIAVITEQQPDVVLLDVEIPGDDATRTVERIRELSPQTKVVVLSMYDGPRVLAELLARGIRGYLLKSATRHELVSAVRVAAADDGRVTLSVSRDSLSQVHRQPPGAGSAAATASLSPRERDVLTLAAQALSNAQIGHRLHLTEATVKRHLSNVFAKIGAVSRIDAVNKAVAAGLIDPPRGDSPRHW
jgi:DNA-binding NarL/FixJ family response regulator